MNNYYLHVIQSATHIARELLCPLEISSSSSSYYSPTRRLWSSSVFSLSKRFFMGVIWSNTWMFCEWVIKYIRCQCCFFIVEERIIWSPFRSSYFMKNYPQCTMYEYEWNIVSQAIFTLITTALLRVYWKQKKVAKHFSTVNFINFSKPNVYEEN